MSATTQNNVPAAEGSAVDLRTVFQPSSIAIVGASERVAYVVTLNKNLHEHKFGGPIYPVNPRRDSIWGVPCYRNIANTPTVPEMAYIAVNKEQVMGLVEECAAVGVKSLIVNSNGYADHPDPEGRAMQEQLTNFVREHGMTMVGPNCLGVFNARGHVAAIAGMDNQPWPGNLVIMSHSGGNTLWLMQAAYDRHIGVSYAVSAGNEAILNICDYLEYLLPDPAAKVFCLFVEMIREPERFMRLAIRAAELNKPIIMVKIGKSSAARGAAIAHTGSFAGPDEFVDALVDRAGVLRASGLDDAMDKCILFGQLPEERWPRGPRIGIFTVGGGLASMTSDLVAARGIEMPSLNADLAVDLRAAYPEKLTIQNPIDTPAIYAGSADAVSQPTTLTSMFTVGCLKDPNFDAVVVSSMTNDPRLSTAFLGALDEAVGETGKPVIFAQPIVKAMTEPWHEFLATSKIAFVTGLDRCATALEANARFQAFRSRLDGSSVSAAEPGLAEHLLEAVTQEIAGGKRVASHSLTFALLGAFGIPVARQAVVSDADAAVAYAHKVGYPVVVKLPNSDTMTHKTELGAVRLNLRSDDEVRTAIAELGELTGDVTTEGFVVQEMVSDALEVYLGASNPGYGYPPAVLAGLGGILLEATRDVSMSLSPVDVGEARRMLSRLRAYQVMTGFRGKSAVDIAAAATAITQISQLAMALRPFFAEMDVNPAMVFPDGGGICVVDALLTYRQG
jgi:acetate---CoA ligase (ADP-forming)